MITLRFFTLDFVNKIITFSPLKPNAPSEGASDFQHLSVHLLVLMIGELFLQLSSLDFTLKRQVDMSAIIIENVSAYSDFYPHLWQVVKGMRFFGGETAALSRVTEYFWSKARWSGLLRLCES